MADEDPPEPLASLSAAEALAVDIDADGDGEVTMDEFSVFAERFLNTPRDPAGPLDPQQVRGPTPAHTRCLVFGWRAAWSNVMFVVITFVQPIGVLTVAFCGCLF